MVDNATISVEISESDSHFSIDTQESASDNAQIADIREEDRPFSPVPSDLNSASHTEDEETEASDSPPAVLNLREQFVTWIFTRNCSILTLASLIFAANQGQEPWFSRLREKRNEIRQEHPTDRLYTSILCYSNERFDEAMQYLETEQREINSEKGKILQIAMQNRNIFNLTGNYSPILTIFLIFTRFFVNNHDEFIYKSTKRIEPYVFSDELRAICYFLSFLSLENTLQSENDRRICLRKVDFYKSSVKDEYFLELVERSRELE